ncbi:MAG: glycoside hydrolase family 15 protein [Sphingomicrobium sp.]
MLDSIINNAVRLLAAVGVGFASCPPAAASPLVTGNGLGFAVVAPESGVATKFYAHPYSFVRPDPANALSEGIETANFIKELGWGARGRAGTAEYVEDTHVIRTRRGGGRGEGSGYFFMPFGLERPALIIAKEAAPHNAAAWRVEWNRPLRSQKVVSAAETDGRILRFDGIDEPLLLIPLGGVRTGTAPEDQPLAASPAWALISLENEGEAEPAIREFVRWRAGLPTRALVRREIAEFEHWRAKPAVRFKDDKERHLWRQSEVMLRIAQSREPNRPDSPTGARHGNGLIVAALPDVYFTPWVRDMAWATVALIRMGHRAEARAALLAYFNARPTGKMRTAVNDADYQISVVRYFGDGAEEPFFTMEGSTNVEFDSWGEALWVLGEYLRNYDDPALLEAATYRGPLYASARDFIVKPLIANTENYGNGRIVAADTSIWEERQKDKKHFAFSTAMAIVGLREFAGVAQRAGDEVARKHALDQLALLEKGFAAAFVRDGKLHGTLEEGVKNDVDGALIPVINFGVVRDPKVIRDTVARMELLKVASGGYRRVRSTYTDPAIFEYWYERQEFLFVDLALAELERRLGRKVEAEAMLERIVDKAAADHNIIPEMYVAVPCKLFPGKIGDPTGALPMVGYGAGAYILHILERGRTANAR